MEALQSVAREQEICKKITEEMKKVIVGKDEQLRLLLICLLSKGHILIEDVPGVGKTTAAGAMAKATGLESKRVQFTPDVMATDISGFTAPDPKTGEFTYKPGVCMTNILIADEINRTSPKTQSALLEVMEERQVTVDGVTYKLPEPFMVVATQNPLGYVGTYPLPEAQLDRFLMKMSMGYPSPAEESRIIGSRHGYNPMDSVVAVSTPEQIIAMQKIVEQIHVDPAVLNYIVNLVCATRSSALVALAASPRASLALMRAACAAAMLDGRTYVIPRDVSEMYEAIVSHRIMLAPEAKIERMTAGQLLETLKGAVKAPIVK
ncbi:MAG: MoxR family ATPase [Clostridia bacterium]|nr:MoxR family ATPase [Clostridia bacterium]